MVCLQHNRTTEKHAFHKTQGNQAFVTWGDTAVFQTLQKAPTRRAYEERKNFPPRIEKGIFLTAVRSKEQTIFCTIYGEFPTLT